MLKTLGVLFFTLLFFVVGAAVLFGINYMLYRWAVRFLAIESQPLRNFLFGVAIFLAFSFPLSSLLIHWQFNGFTRLYYLISSFWLGMLLNLFLVILLAWLIIKLSAINLNQSRTLALVMMVFGLTLIWTLYGVWNAFNPRLKNLDIKIDNLPSQWQGKTIVQLSDLHLGNINRLKFLKEVVEKTNAAKPDIVAITGDLFDGMNGDLTVFVEPLNNLQAAKGIFFITGNHETYLGVNKALAVLNKTKIKVLRNETVQIDGLQLTGLDYSVFGNTKDLVQNLILSQKNFVKGLPSILLYHIPADVEQAKASGINLQLSGHTHHGQLFPVQFLEWLIYKKYYYGLYQDSNFTFYATSGVGTWGPPMRTGNVPEIVAIKLK